MLLREKQQKQALVFVFRMRGGTAMAVRDGQPLLRDKNLGKGYGGRMVSILCRGCETAPETVAEDFPFFDNKGVPPCSVGSDASNRTR